MTRLDELDFALCAAQCTEHAVNAITGIPQNPLHAPTVQPLDEKIANRLGHVAASGNAITSTVRIGLRSGGPIATLRLHRWTEHTEALLGALRAAVDPCLGELSGEHLVAGGRLPPIAGIPTPRDQVVHRYVFL